MKDDDSSELDLDFTELLGPTVGGEWQVKEEVIEEKEADQSDEEVGYGCRSFLKMMNSNLGTIVL